MILLLTHFLCSLGSEWTLWLAGQQQIIAFFVLSLTSLSLQVEIILNADGMVVMATVWH